jgi:hypothetical protein
MPRVVTLEEMKRLLRERLEKNRKSENWPGEPYDVHKPPYDGIVEIGLYKPRDN